ncbi:MAG: hypothetical protein V2A76_15490 [Planctomycetota bacterium]
MRTFPLLLTLTFTLPPCVGCANLIREEQAVIWDRVEGTQAVQLDDLDFDGALVSARLRYFCERQQSQVIQVHETPYSAQNELYEVPVGIPGTACGLVWYVLAEVVTLGAANDAVSTSILDWGAAGLNPFLPVENGMFSDSEIVRIKEGSRRPLKELGTEPYDAAVRVAEGTVRLRFAEPGLAPGQMIELLVRRDTRFELNLLEAAPAMPSAAAQKVLVDADVIWTTDAEPAPVHVEFFVEGDLSRRLFAAREHARRLVSTAPSEGRNAAAAALGELGFSREASMILDRL